MYAFFEAPKLAEMNKQLIADENSDDPMVRNSMRGFLKADYAAYLFREGPEFQGESGLPGAEQVMRYRKDESILEMGM